MRLLLYSKDVGAVTFLSAGKTTLHATNGCEQCQTSEDCTLTDKDESCECPYHDNLRQFQKHATEVKVRRRALEDANFPPEDVRENLAFLPYLINHALHRI